MNDRSILIDEFLAREQWGDARRTTLAGDASFRRYERVYGDGRQAVLMDAPPEKEDIRPFMHIAAILAGHKLSAPTVLAADISHGFLLLEDLGDDLFVRVLQKQPAWEEELYRAAVEVLAELYHLAPKADYSGVAPYDTAQLSREYKLLSEWYLPLICEGETLAKATKEYEMLWQETLTHLPTLPPVLVLRDYHAENLLWLPERSGLQRVGIIDFQDALIGSPAYDMVSFLEDARRDVQPKTVQIMIEAYCTMTNINRADFITAYAMLGAQRNCKIIGIFCRLALRDGKRHYLSLLPRVWNHLAHDIKHPALTKLRLWCDTYIAPSMRGELHIDMTTRRAQSA